VKAHANATFDIKSWDEKPHNEVAGMPKLTRASVSRVFHGDFEGDGTAEYLMIYRPDNSANFVGMERMVGKLGGRSGSFVLQRSGTDDGKTTHESYFVVLGSGTGDLKGLKGEGVFLATHAQPSYSFTLDYDFE
jgi:hypothetical protein